MYQDINLGSIFMKKGGMGGSDSVGKYQEFEFKFTDLTLKYLSKQIEAAESLAKKEKED